MRPIFCGNLPLDARCSDVECLFGRHGRVVSVNLQSGYAFVHMEDELDAQNAIRKLNCSRFGRKGPQLCVEWTRDDYDRSRTNSKPSKTLLVMNFDPVKTRSRDIEKHFGHYERIFMDGVISVDYAVGYNDNKIKNGLCSPDRRRGQNEYRGYNNNKMKNGPCSPDRRRGQYEYRDLRIDSHERSPTPSRRDDDDDVIRIPTSIVNVFVCVFFLFLLYAF